MVAPIKLLKGGSAGGFWPPSLSLSQLSCENKIFFYWKDFIKRKTVLTNHQILPCLHPGVDYFYGRILIVKILNINIDDTGLASCQLQIVLLNTPHRLYLETVKTVLWTKLTDLDLIYKKITVETLVRLQQKVIQDSWKPRDEENEDKWCGRRWQGGTDCTQDGTSE